MAIAEDKKLTHTFADYLVNKKVAEAAKMLAPDVVYKAPGFPEIRGPQEWQALTSQFFANSPNLQMTMQESVAERSAVALKGGEATTVASRYVWNTVHEREFMGVPPTGKKLAVTSISMYRVVNGKITEIYVLDDYLGLFRQLGSIPLAFLQDKMTIPGVGKTRAVAAVTEF
jgi:predicted ester cyclase